MKKNKIKFLATGDFHSDLKLVKRIKDSKHFNDIDFILFIGDLSEKNNDFKDLFGNFKGKQIFMVPGNHESKQQLDILEKNYNVHLLGNAPVKIHDNLALFGSNYVPLGPYAISEEDIFENLKNNFDAVKDFKFKIMLNHLPPHNTTIGDMSPFAFIEGGRGVREFIDNFTPEIALCGHIHESSGLEEIVNKTKVINVGRTFKIFEFDTEKEILQEIKE